MILPGEFDEAVRALERGCVVAAATESSFGLLARVDSSAAIDRLERIKPRGGLKGTGLILPDLESWPSVAQVEPLASRLAQALWPGAVSIVQPATTSLDPRLGLGGSIAVRLPVDCPALRLARALGVPLTATSANLPGAPPIDDSREITQVFADDVARGDLFPLVGRSPGGPPSTLIALREGGLAFLRVGAVPVEAVQRAFDALRI